MYEVLVKISNEEQTFKQKFLEYTYPLVVSKEEGPLKAIVEEAVGNFKGKIDDIWVTIKYCWGT